MPIIRLQKQREALTMKSEDYKGTIRRYLVAQGYRPWRDSAIEGIVEDMLFAHPVSGKPVAVEVKARSLKVRDADVGKAFAAYFNIWAATKNGDRFQFQFYVQSAPEGKEWDRIFKPPQDKKAVDAFIDSIMKNAAAWIGTPFGKGARKKLAEFISSTEIIVATGAQLIDSAKKHTDIGDAALGEYGRQKAAEIERRRRPLGRKSVLRCNIVPLRLPIIYYQCRIDATSRDEVFQKLPDETIPAFDFLSEKSIISLEPINDRNPLERLRLGKVIELVTEELQTEEPQHLVRLINRTIHAVTRKRGMWCRNHTYYFPLFVGEGDDRYFEISGRKIRVAHAYRHQESNEYHKKGDLNFVFHDGLEFTAFIQWGKPFLSINPRRFYTADGMEPFADSKAISNIDARFRTPEMNRNSAHARTLSDWKSILFGDPFSGSIDGNGERPVDRWVRRLGAGELLEFKIDWVPEAAKKDVPGLENYGDKP